MKRFAKKLSLPVLFAGLILIGTQAAEAGLAHRHARLAHVHRHHYAAPAVIYTPPVRVYASPVRVYAPPVRVYSSGLRVHVGPWVPSRYGYSYYYGW